MKILDLISQAAREQGLECLLIGGHAINATGDRRHTRDVDLVVCETERKRWEALLSNMDYKLFNDSGAFLQFSPPDLTQWPVDLMLVNERTFSGLRDGARVVNLGGQHDVLTPSIEHLIAMKLHAMKQGPPARRLRDLLDIITLVRQGRIDVGGDDFKQLCERYGSRETHAEIVKTLQEEGPRS